MNVWKVLYPALVIILLTGCATVQQPEVVNIMPSEPEISKTLLAADDYSLKRKVTIVRFSNETQYGRGNLFNNEDTKIGNQAMDILSTKLTKTGKFLMFERPDLEGMNFANTDSSTFKLASDYVIVGSVSEFGRANTSEVDIFSRTKKQTANAKVNIRLVNVKTGQVIYAEEGSGEASSEAGTVLGGGSHAGYDSSLNDKALDAAISKLVSNVVENLLNEAWRAYILDIDGDQIIMSGGKSQNIKVGDTFAVMKRGKVVHNPQTGIDIELPGEVIGKLRIDSQLGQTLVDEISICSLVEGDVSGFSLADIFVAEIME
ncbi:MAG: CsgG/HfaB family protein [Candidatus Cloacimonetes bacterium]|nr:CsgG/HfaB family protein [Candidatus Cloacimonadota bacterium]